MRMILVDQETGEERGWIEWTKGILQTGYWPKGLDKVKTVAAFCGIPPINPPQEIWIE